MISIHIYLTTDTFEYCLHIYWTLGSPLLFSIFMHLDPFFFLVTIILPNDLDSLYILGNSSLLVTYVLQTPCNTVGLGSFP